jgi:site-specific DNA-methyltransferase (adenine-specific)
MQSTPGVTTEVPGAKLYCADALDVLRSLPDSSIDLIATDPPYFRVKGLAWDRAWDNADGFLAWIGLLADEWRRVLKSNGSLYCFASPRMAARVEVAISSRLDVLNRIRWVKTAGWHNKTEKEALRSFLSPWEEIIFAEHYGADNAAKGESGYGAECDKLRGFVFEPLRAWFCDEKARLGLTNKDINLALGTATNGSGMAGHYFKSSGAVQWELPTEHHYAKLSKIGFSREYENLRREYEDLRREYEDLRRPFAVTADVPYTDVWDFKTVPHKPGKHVCEKPFDLCEHIILASSRPGAVVLDSFCGSGAFGHAAVKHGRTFIGSDNDPHWIAKSAARINAVTAIPPPPPQASLFPDAVQKTAAPAPQQRGLFLPESIDSWQ